MYLSDLALDNFRSWEHVVLSLEPGVNAFLGGNGQGKTNLMEAIAYLSTLSSHRVGTDSSLVRRTQPGQQQPAGAVIRAKVMRAQRPSVVELEIIAGRANRARLSRTAVKPREILGLVRSVVFSPEDLSLVRDDPSVRRRFLDDLCTQVRPRFASIRATHDKVLAQRAGLLKSARAASGSARSSMLSTLDVWDAQLAASAAAVISARVSLLDALEPALQENYQLLSGDSTPVSAAYRASVLLREGHEAPDPARGDWHELQSTLRNQAELEQRLLAAMAQAHDEEIERGVNLVGAHRDDLSLFLGPLPAKGFASHGEQWSVALALRLAAYHCLSSEDVTQESDGEPILILDDVFASLDSSRRRALARVIAPAQQVCITGAVAEDVPDSLHAQVYTVGDGQVQRG